MLVVDSSAVLEALAAHDPATGLVERLAGDGDLHAPHLIDTEVLHALRRMLRKGQISGDRADDARTGFSDLTALRRRYKRAANAAGLRPIRLHGLRHAAGSVLARNGVPLITIRDFYGHANLSTTNRYLHSKLDEDAVAAMNAAHGIADSSRPSGRNA